MYTLQIAQLADQHLNLAHEAGALGHHPGALAGVGDHDTLASRLRRAAVRASRRNRPRSGASR